MDFNGQFRRDEDSYLLNCSTPLKNSKESEQCANSQTQTITKILKFQVQETLIEPKQLFPEMKRKWSLKHISSRVIQELSCSSMSYSDMSLKLSEELMTEMSETDEAARTKEAQNLRRRVYDALNVLISIGLVTKDKKLLRRNRGPQISMAKAAMIKKKDDIKQQMVIKRDLANTLMKKEDYIKELINLNKSRLDNDDQRIYFPFLAVKSILTNAEEDELVIEQHRDCKSLMVYSRNPLVIDGDINVLQSIFGNRQIL